MVKRSPRRIARETPREKLYKAWIHEQMCVAHPGVSNLACIGPIEQSHERSMTGMGRKEPNLRSIPMCRHLHQTWEQHDGFFTGWTKARRRAWFDIHVRYYNAKFDKEHPVSRDNTDGETT
jgi:hypothetical protein